jgi:hypothetical protein
VLEAQAQPIERLASGLRLRMPGRSEAVPYVCLADLRDREVTEFRDNVQLQRAEPSSGPAVALQLGFSAFEDIVGEILQ